MTGLKLQTSVLNRIARQVVPLSHNQGVESALVSLLPTVVVLDMQNGCHGTQYCISRLSCNQRRPICEIRIIFRRGVVTIYLAKVFFKNGPIPASFSGYFRLFNKSQFKLIKAQVVCLGLEPGVAGWKAQTNPLSCAANVSGQFF